MLGSVVIEACQLLLADSSDVLISQWRIQKFVLEDCGGSPPQAAVLMHSVKSVFVNTKMYKLIFLSLDLFSLTLNNIFLALLGGIVPPHGSATVISYAVNHKFHKSSSLSAISEHCSCSIR